MQEQIYPEDGRPSKWPEITRKIFASARHGVRRFSSRHIIWRLAEMRAREIKRKEQREKKVDKEIEEKTHARV